MSKNLKKSVARRSGRGGVLPATDTLVGSLLTVVPWIIIGIASIGGASVSSRRLETLDARTPRQLIGSSDLKAALPAVDNDFDPFSSPTEYSMDEEKEGGGGIGGDDGDEDGSRIGSDDVPVEDSAAGGDISDGMSIKSKLSSGCSPSVVVTYDHAPVYPFSSLP